LGTTSSTIFIVDDHPVVRRGLSDLIEGEPDLSVCGESGDPGETLTAMKGTKPDIAIVDLKLQEGSGFDLTKQIKTQFPEVKVLIHSMYDELSYVEQVIRAGASGYVSKQDPAGHVIQAIRDMLAGKVYISPSLKDALLMRGLGQGEVSSSEDPMSVLSPRESQVFEMLGQGLSIREIAGQLSLSPRTIETYRDGIKNKLGLDSMREVIREATRWTLQQ